VLVELGIPDETSTTSTGGFHSLRATQ
jgi:hypothetical protein